MRRIAAAGREEGGDEGTSSVAEVYEIKFPVRPGDIDQLEHVNNVAYLRWVQDVAVAHWTARATKQCQDELLWVVLRHEIDYKQSARLGDEIRALTWVGAATRVRFDRFTELRRAADDVLLAKARSVWCPINAQTRRPAGVSADLLELFSSPCAEKTK
jgi:acyl-CoA thioester hydrolase